MIDVINIMLLKTIINLVSLFVNKFTFSIMTFNNVIFFLFIAFFIAACCFCYCVVLPLQFIKYILKTNASAENYYQLNATAKKLFFQGSF